MPFDLTTAKPVDQAPPKTKFDLSTAKPADATQSNPEASMSEAQKWGQAVKNVAKAGAHYATGFVGGALGDAAGLASLLAPPAMIARKLGYENGIFDPANVRDTVSNALTYNPDDQNTLSMKIVTAPGKVIGAAGGYLQKEADKVDSSGLLGHVANAVPQAFLARVGAKYARGVPEGEAPILTPAQQIVENARKSGLKITPKEAKAPIASGVEGLAGSAALERSISKANQPVVNGIARNSIGLPGDGYITAQEIAGLKSKWNGAYDALAKTGKVTADKQFLADVDAIGGKRVGGLQQDFPGAVNSEIENLKATYAKPSFSAQSAISASRQLRAHASKNIKSDNPATVDLGYAQKDLANAFDSQLQRHADALGDPTLSTGFQLARENLAKIHTVEDALNETTRDIEVPTLAKMLDRGEPLSGGLKQLAEAGRVAPKSLQKVDKLPNEHLLGSAFDIGMGAVGANAAIAGHPYLAPLAFIRPALRGVLKSDAYQTAGSGLSQSAREKIAAAMLAQQGEQQ